MEATLDLFDELSSSTRSVEEKESPSGKALAALAHQIRNPLTVAGLQLSQLSEDASAELRGKISKVCDSLRRIEDCLQSSLAFVGGELRDNSDFPAIQLNDEFRRVCAYTLSESALEWHCLIDDSINIHGSCKALVSALLNLVDNAELACGSELQLCVVFSVQRNQLIIEVHDNGPGIPVAELGNVKQPYVSGKAHSHIPANSTTSRRMSEYRCQGLGLSITNSVVNAHRGSFTLMSDAGMGVNAVVRLPLVK